MFVSERRPLSRARSALLAGSSGLELGYGRFMQTDPLGYDDGLNWYNYVGGDPVNFTDPTGMFCANGSAGSSDADCAGAGGYVPGSPKEQPQGPDVTVTGSRGGDTGPPSPAGPPAAGPAPGSSGGEGGGGPATSPKEITCKGTATFSAVGPLPQAAGDSAFAPGTKPANGTVAIAGAQTFGFGRRALREGAAAAIQIYPQGLTGVLQATGGPQPPYSVGDYGDANIRNAPDTRFDIYRFSTMKGAQAFGKRTVAVTIKVPAGGHCPAGTTAQ